MNVWYRERTARLAIGWGLVGAGLFLGSLALAAPGRWWLLVTALLGFLLLLSAALVLSAWGWGA